MIQLNDNSHFFAPQTPLLALASSSTDCVGYATEKLRSIQSQIVAVELSRS
jgi:hypothetical protein